MPPKSIFSALGAPMSLAWVHESSCVEGSALPKSVESGKLSLNKVGIGRMSVSTSEVHFREGFFFRTSHQLGGGPHDKVFNEK